jgi:cytochrome c biogenesis protein CcdA/thiol-disulfide isomerase/thioredoxin
MLSLLITSYISGLLTVLAPCVLPLLPIIIGSSVSGNAKWKPVRITLALAFSIIAFTLLLKVSTAFIGIDPIVWKYVSGGIVVFFGLITLFPDIWNKISLSLGLSSNSDKLLEKAGEKQGWAGDLAIGAALGPVFASCSPTYGLILATVLPVNFAEGLLYLTIYSLGLATVLLAIAILGRKLINKLKFAANPNGWFKKILGVIFILVGIAVITGFDKKVETFVLDSGFFDVTKIEEKLLPKKEMIQSNFAPTEGTKMTDVNKLNLGSNTTNMLKDLMPTSNMPLSGAPQSGGVPELNVKGEIKAPEIRGITQWFNSNGESLENLKGKVVLVDFWTYSCINCQRTLPYITKLYDTYKDKGLVVLGLHAPEFQFEKVSANVQKAVIENKINYPVGLDNDFKTWNAYENQFWPASYLIDKEGKIRRTHFGEGEYAETEKAIRFLLDEKSLPMVNDTSRGEFQDQYSKDCANKSCATKTPETYLGSARTKSKVLFNQELKANEWAVNGNWTQGKESLSTTEGGKLKIKVNASKVYIVAGSKTGSGITIKVNGIQTNNFNISVSKLYELTNNNGILQDAEMELTFDGPVELNAFTFG